VRVSLAACVVAAVLAAPAGAARTAYVSGGLAGPQQVSALTIGADGSLTSVPGSPFPSGGTTTEGIAMTPNAARVYVANFGTSTISGFNVAANGGLSAIAGSPFAGGVNDLGVAPSPNGNVVFAWNHGGAIASLTVAANGALSLIGPPFPVPAPQTNPFGGSVAPDGRHLYVPNENSTETVPGCGGTCEVNRVTAYSVAPNGALAALESEITGTTNVNPSGPNPFGSGITPDGRFLYVSNPEDGPNGTISGFGVDSTTGLLTPLAGFPLNVSPGNHPLNMAVSPDSKHLYVATRISKTVNAYTINANGSLTPVPGQPFATDAADVNGKALALTPDGKRLYVTAGGTDNNVTGFNVGVGGELTKIPGSPWPTGGGTSPDLEAIAITPNQPPAASFTAAAATQGQATAFNAGGSTDSDGTVARYDWDFGDGTTLADGGATPSHVYTQPGSYLASVRETDNEGCSTDRIFTGKAMLCNGSSVAETARTVTITATTPTTPTTTPSSPNPPLPVLPLDLAGPAISSVAVVPRRFAVDPRGVREVSVAAAAKGATIRYSLSEAARVVFTVHAKTTGRVVSGTCRRKTRRNRKRRKCTLLTRRGSFAKDSGQGDNIKRFSGKIGRTTLRPGRYQLTLDGTDAAGNRGASVVTTFTIVRR